MRGHIKDALLGMLANENKDTLKNTSICLGTIAAIEVPDGHWNNFLQLMSDNSTQEIFQYRLASIQTLGFMTEFIDEYIGKELSVEQLGSILHATICNIDVKSIELTTIAIKALSRTITSTKQICVIKEQRDFIMNGLFRAIEMDDEDIQNEALQALAEVPEIAYEYIVEYIPKIG